MKSLRDLAKRMPTSRKGLEDYVLKYDSEVKDAVDRDPNARVVLEKVTEDTFEKYEQYVNRGFWGGLAQKASGLGHATGHASDAYAAHTWMTGFADLPAALGGKAIHLLAQIPDAMYGVYYAAKTGYVGDALKRIGEGLLSYLPGATLVDEGMTRIVQKRMAKQATYEVREKLGLNRKKWEDRIAERKDAEGYTGVKARTGNVIRVDFNERERIKKVA